MGRALGWTRSVTEVSALALRTGAGRRTGRREVEVDLARLARRLRVSEGLPPGTIVVGHLAHLLPIRDVVVLRCRPDELARRLHRARRGTTADRQENFLAEALDVVGAEARGLRRRVWELDTTGSTVTEVAGRVGRIADRRPPPAAARVDWLSDERVSAHLLDPPG